MSSRPTSATRAASTISQIRSALGPEDPRREGEHGEAGQTEHQGDDPVTVRALVGLIPDLTFAPQRGYIAADHMVIEYAMSGTFGGSPFVCDGVDVIAVSDGLVARKDTYLDLTALVSQVGPLPDLSTEA